MSAATSFCLFVILRLFLDTSTGATSTVNENVPFYELSSITDNGMCDPSHLHTALVSSSGNMNNSSTINDTLFLSFSVDSSLLEKEFNQSSATLNCQWDLKFTSAQYGVVMSNLWIEKNVNLSFIWLNGSIHFHQTDNEVAQITGTFINSNQFTIIWSWKTFPMKESHRNSDGEKKLFIFYLQRCEDNGSQFSCSMSSNTSELNSKLPQHTSSILSTRNHNPPDESQLNLQMSLEKTGVFSNEMDMEQNVDHPCPIMNPSHGQYVIVNESKSDDFIGQYFYKLQCFPPHQSSIDRIVPCNEILRLDSGSYTPLNRTLKRFPQCFLPCEGQGHVQLPQRSSLNSTLSLTRNSSFICVQKYTSHNSSRRIAVSLMAPANVEEEMDAPPLVLLYSKDQLCVFNTTMRGTSPRLPYCTRETVFVLDTLYIVIYIPPESKLSQINFHLSLTTSSPPGCMKLPNTTSPSQLSPPRQWQVDDKLQLDCPSGMVNRNGKITSKCILNLDGNVDWSTIKFSTLCKPFCNSTVTLSSQYTKDVYFISGTSLTCQTKLIAPQDKWITVRVRAHHSIPNVIMLDLNQRHYTLNSNHMNVTCQHHQCQLFLSFNFNFQPLEEENVYLRISVVTPSLTNVKHGNQSSILTFIAFFAGCCIVAVILLFLDVYYHPYTGWVANLRRQIRFHSTHRRLQYVHSHRELVINDLDQHNPPPTLGELFERQRSQTGLVTAASIHYQSVPPPSRKRTAHVCQAPRRASILGLSDDVSPTNMTAPVQTVVPVPFPDRNSVIFHSLNVPQKKMNQQNNGFSPRMNKRRSM